MLVFNDTIWLRWPSNEIIGACRAGDRSHRIADRACLAGGRIVVGTAGIAAVCARQLMAELADIIAALLPQAEGNPAMPGGAGARTPNWPHRRTGF
jgi:hypothetical protein